ncbi:hypothetical protein D3C72_2121480 [compost metagenome]
MFEGKDLFAGLGRAIVLNELVANNVILTNVPHHLLGVWENPLEIKQLAEFKWIRGVDTQLPFWAAAEGIVWSQSLGMTERRDGRNIVLDDASVVLDEPTLNHNILCMQSWANESV